MFLFPLDTEPEIAIVARVSITDDNVREIFGHWRKYHDQQFKNPQPTFKEWQKIKLRFQEGYSVAQLCRAIDGMHKSPWHLGENPGGKKYLSLELCLRDAGKVEMFLEMANTPSEPVLSEKTKRTVRALDSWASRGGEDEKAN